MSVTKKLPSSAYAESLISVSSIIMPLMSAAFSLILNQRISRAKMTRCAERGSPCWVPLSSGPNPLIYHYS